VQLFQSTALTPHLLPEPDISVALTTRRLTALLTLAVIEQPHAIDQVFELEHQRFDHSGIHQSSQNRLSVLAAEDWEYADVVGIHRGCPDNVAVS
jgi:hypothetical protein